MEEKDRGRAFLFSKYYGFIDNEDEDGDYQIYSDGSGYYHGSDGSEAQIYSDGSGYFHGADGSEAQIYSDGSGYYIWDSLEDLFSIHQRKLRGKQEKNPCTKDNQ